MEAGRLDDDDHIRKVIAQAEHGSQQHAWFLVAQLELALQSQKIPAALSEYAAGFFTALLDLRENGRETPKELAKALQALNIVKSRGQPPRDPDEQTWLAARMVLVTDAGYSMDTAAGALSQICVGDDSGPYPERAYKNAYEMRGAAGDRNGETEGAFLRRTVDITELEAFAGVKSAEVLLAQLVADGLLVPPVRRPDKK